MQLYLSEPRFDEPWERLPEDLQSIVRVACQAVNTDMTAEFMARNADAPPLGDGRADVVLR